MPWWHRVFTGQLGCSPTPPVSPCAFTHLCKGDPFIAKRFSVSLGIGLGFSVASVLGTGFQSGFVLPCHFVGQWHQAWAGHLPLHLTDALPQAILLGAKVGWVRKLFFLLLRFLEGFLILPQNLFDVLHDLLIALGLLVSREFLSQRDVELCQIHSLFWLKRSYDFFPLSYTCDFYFVFLKFSQIFIPKRNPTFSWCIILFDIYYHLFC